MHQSSELECFRKAEIEMLSIQEILSEVKMVKLMHVAESVFIVSSVQQSLCLLLVFKKMIGGI